MAEKLCIFCKHFSFENEYGQEYAEGASASCGKGHYKAYSSNIYDENDLRAILVRAKDCPDYDPPK